MHHKPLAITHNLRESTERVIHGHLDRFHIWYDLRSKILNSYIMIRKSQPAVYLITTQHHLLIMNTSSKPIFLYPATIICAMKLSTLCCLFDSIRGIRNGMITVISLCSHKSILAKILWTKHQNIATLPHNRIEITFCECRQISNIRHILVGNKIVDYSDVVGTSPVGAASTTSSLST